MRRTRSTVIGAAVLAGALLTGGAVVGAVVAQSEPGPEVQGNTISAGPGRLLAQSSATEDRFKAITPCRLIDTRVAGGRFAATEFRNFKAVGEGAAFADQGGKPGGCAIDTAATAVTLTVTSVTAEGTGFIRIYPAGATEPNATFMNYGTGFNASGSGPVKIRVNGAGISDFRLRNYGSTTHVVVDVTGYTVPPRWVRVAGNGDYVDGSRVFSVTKVGTGQYRVQFDGSVADCSAVASGPATNTGSGNTQVTASRSGTAVGQVFVETRTATGTLKDEAFTLQVEC